jgi:TolB-like protein/Tfp pilus assembly protein PilF
LVQQSLRELIDRDLDAGDKDIPAPRFYEFGPFRLDARERLLFRERQLLSLPLKVFETLLALVEHRGQVLEKPQLVKLLWPDTHVGSRSLAQNVFILRKVLGGDHSQFIETIPKRGYRFLAPVKTGNSEKSAADERAGSYAGVAGPADDALPIRLVAVLPFEPLGENTEGNYLGVGLADAVVTRLSAMEGVIVRPTSVIAHTPSTQDLMSIGQELGVDSIFEGRIQQSGDKIRITARLINAHNGAPLWADKFDGRLAGIFALQDAISERAAQAVAVNLSGSQVAKRTGHGTASAAAYQLYLKGRFHWNQRTPQGFRKAIQCFQLAIEQDPSYALAWAGLADCHILLHFYGTATPQDSYRQAFAAATRAVEIDPQLVEAVTSLAFISAAFEWNWPKAEREFQRAFALKPNYATAHHWHAEYLMAMGRQEEAIAAIVRAQEMEPLSLIINCAVGLVFYFARKYDTAIEQLEQTLEIDPNFFAAYRELGQVYEQLGMHREAIAALEKSTDLCPGNRYMEAFLSRAYAAAQENEKSQQVLDRLTAESANEYVSPYLFAIVHAGRGEYDLAFQWLDRAFEERSNWLIYLKVDPVLDNLRTDARFANLLRRMKFPD